MRRRFLILSYTPVREIGRISGQGTRFRLVVREKGSISGQGAGFRLVVREKGQISGWGGLLGKSVPETWRFCGQALFRYTEIMYIWQSWNYSGSPSTIKWHEHKYKILMPKIMESHLNVKTVQTFEPGTLEPHTAYTVFMNLEEKLMVASGWTLKDAISLFADIYCYDKAELKVLRPFHPQILQMSDHEVIF